MRDINRIDIFCDELKRIWKKCPDLRFSQIINLVFIISNKQDLFYVDDAEMLFYIQDIEKRLEE